MHKPLLYYWFLSRYYNRNLILFFLWIHREPSLHLPPLGFPLKRHQNRVCGLVDFGSSHLCYEEYEAASMIFALSDIFFHSEG